MQYAYCSSLNCKHSQLYGHRMNKFGSGEHVPMQQFCTDCGAPMIGECPNCKAPRESMDYKCCPACGKPYK